MPELPEVETIVRELNRTLRGKVISHFRCTTPKILNRSVATFQRALRGKTVTAVRRRAKVISIEYGRGQRLGIHLKMTGQLILRRPNGAIGAIGGHPIERGLENLPNQFTRAEFVFRDGTVLFFNDLRKFGWIRILTATDWQALHEHHGVEPLERAYTWPTFQTLLATAHRRTVKQFLLDQTKLAGVGNIYADESCFLAHILPTRTVASLTPAEARALFRVIPPLLRRSIKAGGTSADRYVRTTGQPGGFLPHLYVYGRDGKPCKRCRQTIKKTRHQGRGTHFCPRCQK